MMFMRSGCVFCAALLRLWPPVPAVFALKRVLGPGWRGFHTRTLSMVPLTCFRFRRLYLALLPVDQQYLQHMMVCGHGLSGVRF